MTDCNRILDLLDEFVDGTLSAADRAAVDDHLEGCPDCRNAVDELRELTRRLATLPTAAAPARDLWPDIARRLADEHESTPHGRSIFGLRRHLGWLAAAAVLVVASSVITAHFVRRPPATAATAPAGAGFALAALRPAEAHYRSARAALLDALAQRRASLDPATLAVVDHNLAIIDGAIANIGRALERDPNNRELARLLAGAYVREIDLLQRATQLPDTAGGRT